MSYLGEIKNFFKINNIELIMPIVRNEHHKHIFITLTNNGDFKRLLKVFEKFILTEKRSTELVTI